jgi:hypothetical protein
MARVGIQGWGGVAGASAQREYERLRAHRKALDRRVLPWIGAFAVVLAVLSHAAIEHHLPGGGWVGPLLILSSCLPFLGPSRQEVNWRRGAEGERIVGAALDALEPVGFRSLHDRRMPRSRANIDHIAVMDGSVYTVDAKRYSGAISVGRGALIIKGRDRSKLLEQARRQRDVVRSALRAAGYRHVPVTPVLCFTGVEWPLFFPPRRAGDVQLCSPRRLRRALRTDEPTEPHPAVDELHAILDRAFPPVVEAPGAGPPGGGLVERVAAAGASPAGTLPAEAPVHPICRCGSGMVRRTRRSDGRPFYGCSAYPSCKLTRPF